MMISTRLARRLIASVLLAAGSGFAQNAGAKPRPDAIQIAPSATVF